MDYNIERMIVVPGHPDYDNGYSRPPYRQVHLHSTANKTATMEGEVAYVGKNYPNGYYNFLVGGGGRIIQVAEVNGGAWDVGGDWNHETYAAIEFSENVKDQDDFNKSYKAYIWLARHLADEAGASYDLDDDDIVGIKTHWYASKTGHGSDHTDPIAFLASWGITYDQLKRDLIHGIEDGTPVVVETPVTVPAPQPTAPDQILEPGSKVRIDGVFSLDNLVQYNGGWYAVSVPLSIPRIDYNNYIPVGPLTETDANGNPTPDQDFSNAGHSYFTFGGQVFTVEEVDAGTDTVKVNIAGEPVWMPAGPLTEV